MGIKIIIEFYTEDIQVRGKELLDIDLSEKQANEILSAVDKQKMRIRETIDWLIIDRFIESYVNQNALWIAKGEE